MAATAGPLNLMACVRESSPQDVQPDSDTSRHETTKKRRFHPFRGLRRMFRRKVRHSGADEELPPEELPGVDPGPALDTHRSRSTSELLAADDPAVRRRSGNGLYPCHSGLSVSHDSVFTAEQRTPHSSSEDLDTAQSSSSLSIQQLVPGVRRELFDAVRRRRGRGDTSEEDEDLGLPRSPCNSPTTADVLLEPGVKLQENPSRSTGSDGSLLSMGSSEMDEDSSSHSGKISLSEKKTNIGDMDLDLGSPVAPLSHDAARHKMAVRPKRTYGAPRRRKVQQIAGSPLPATPEVNEELSGRSASPEVKSRHDLTAALSTSDATPLETQLKSASLPPGLALSSAAEASVKLARSHSNATYRQTETSHYKRTISASELDSSVASALASEVLARTREMFGPVGEEEEEEKPELAAEDKTAKEKDEKKEESFFGRLLLRRSGKKKKEKSDEVDTVSSGAPPHKIAATELPSIIPKRIDEKGRYANDTVVEQSTVRQFSSKSSMRSTAASRQRIEPINLPPSPEPERKEEPLPITPPVPAPRLSIESDKASASQMKISYSVSPPKPTWPELRKTPEPVPEKRLPETILEPKPKSKIAGLSSYQQRITQLGHEVDFEEREFSSLITTVEEKFVPKVVVKKSKSFRGDIDFMSAAYKSSFSSAKNEDKEFQEEVKPRRASSVVDESEDRLSLLSSLTTATQILNGDDEDLHVEESPVIQTSETETTQYTKNIYITSTTTENIENVEQSNTVITKQPEPAMKKSSSLDSINSGGEITKSDSVPLGNVSKISPSIENMNNLTQQVTGPVGPTGISITQTVQLQEEALTTTSSTKVESVTVTLQQDTSSEPSTVTRVQPETPKMPRPALVKRESRPIVTPEPQIPEFLRVQLNRVDSKPAVNVVLSTSAVFDVDTPRMQSRLRSAPEKPTSVQVNLIEVSDSGTADTALRLKKDLPLVDSTPTAALKVRRKSSREELNESEPFILDDSRKILTQDPPVKTDDESVVVKSQRIISVVSAPSPSVRKSLPVTSAPPLSPPTVKSNLRKQAHSLDSPESRNAALKKQKSFDLDQNEPIVDSTQETSYQEVVLRKKSLPWEIVLKKDEDSIVLVEAPSSASEPLFSQESIDVAPQKKTKSREFGNKKDEDNVTTAVTEPITSQESIVSEVVLRKKSLSREITQRKEEEPELLKVFARRSLKLKDSDSEALSQQVIAKARENQTPSEQQVGRSRDSDKENEGGDSPREERKRQSTKEPLIFTETPVKSSTVGITLNNARSSTPAGFKYPRNISNGNCDNSTPSTEPVLAVYQKDNTTSPEKRQRSKTVPESPRTDIEKNSHRMWASMYKENNIELSNTETRSFLDRVSTQADTSSDKEETSIPRFKRIQQRKEEWELRAQQAAKKTLP